MLHLLPDSVPPERVVNNLHRFGNTSAASIPLVLAEAIERIEAAGDGKVTRRARLDAGLDNP